MAASIMLIPATTSDIFLQLQNIKKDCDIYRVSKALGHSSIAITEKYLKGLNVIA